MKKYYLLNLITIILGTQLLFSQIPSKEECFNSLKNKYGKMNTVSFSFASPEVKSLQGSLIAAKGNKYVLETKDRAVYCNGETIWNYMKDDNKLLISVFDEINTSPMALEKFFFNFLEKYSPSDLTESTSSLGTKSLILTLTPIDEKSYNIDDFKIWIEPNTYIVKSIKLKIAGKIQTLNISDLVINKKFSDKTFVYVPTGKEQVMDFR